MMRHLASTFPKSGILLLGKTVQSLVPSTLISQAESLLDAHRIEDASNLADQQRKKLQANITVDEDEADELRYVYQRIGFQCFSETLFEDAGKHFFNGDLDPRVLVSYYPELRGSLLTSNATADVFAGVAEHMPPESSVDDIIRNYSPFLDTQTAPPTAELRRILGMAAVEMLESFLKKCRRKRVVEGRKEPEPSFAVVDTVLAKLYAQGEKTADLRTLIEEPNSIVLVELEPVLKTTGQYHALSLLYRQSNNDEGLLEIWSKIIDNEWTEPDIPDPIGDMLTLLMSSRNRPLIQKWGLWLTRRNPERGLTVIAPDDHDGETETLRQLLMPKDSGKRPQRPDDDLALLKDIQEANPAAGARFLEYLVLQKRSLSRDLHTQLATVCVDQMLSALKDDSVSKLWRAKASSYASSHESNSTFFSYFVSTTPDSPSKLSRLKALLFLQGSSLYDGELIRSRLAAYRQQGLSLELAVVDGKLQNHQSALSALVNDLQDSTSAEAYCTLGGDVIPSKSIQTLCGDPKLGLSMWTSAWTGKSKQKTVDETVSIAKRKELLKTLLQVYMHNQTSNVDRAARLINAQAMNLDVVEVLPVVPEHWSVQVMSSFLSRSFRRTVHAQNEGRIVKALANGQNMRVKEETYPVLRDEGMVVEEAGDDGSFDEKVDGEKDAARWSSAGAVDIM
ncbi:unnamed protein product [Mycena citricolor]|uniref:Vacuolar sorting protein 39/Transforming growth factor beta receptor-associated domain-containing protein n=1 Tax=Mycena citricolor TaxID=2018698 RepID=A0AAD2HK37_9AGAR|nr:unnamed protein product [Mycena citricolor]